ncbi:MAG: DUF975 family protein [Candidatus Paceibacterota bacterium]|jgi:uncharacterized membrane protein
MKKDNALLMKEARETLAGRWGLAIGFCFLYMLITIVVQSPRKIGSLFGLVIGGPMLFGLATFSLAFSRKQEASVSQLFLGFNEFGRTFVAYFLRILFILLWALLLIVPGIIAALSYSQTFYILAEDKTISGGEAIKKSKAMMYGNKKKLFFLCLRFLGWALLSILTLGIGFLWLIPYVQITMAKFYDDISGKMVAPNPAPAQ